MANQTVELTYDQLVEELSAARAELAAKDYLLHTDQMTGCGNRRAFMRDLQQALDHGEAVYITLADLDGLKGINDRYGHGVGNQAIAAIAGHPSLGYRLHGDELAGLSSWRPDPTPISAEIFVDGVSIRVTASSYSVKIDTLCTALENVAVCDKGLYRDKVSKDRRSNR